LMFTDLFGGEGFQLISSPEEVTSVLDLCTGSGCLAILAAGLFANADIDAADLSNDALAVAEINLREHDLANRINLLQGDLWEAVERRTYDLIITNPPYVAAEEVAAFPPEYAQEPEMAHIGGADGLDIVRRILDEAPQHLNPGGGLLCEIGVGRDILEEDYPNLNFFWLDTAESEGEVFWLTRDQFSA
jgi:ribosomal protein L3 glutamine methyltransferase